MQLREDELLRLEAATRPAGVPLLIARSYGLAGYLRVHLSSIQHGRLALPGRATAGCRASVW